jgi:hypothetical protein
MKNLIIIIIFITIFGGCTINFGQTKPEKEIKTEITETKEEKRKPWPHVKKEFWYAKYFLTMAMNPQVQIMMTPEQVFDVVRCTVDGFEKDYEFERFLKEIGLNKTLTPQLNKYVYDLSYGCSLEVKRKAKEKQGEEPITLKQSV